MFYIYEVIKCYSFIDIYDVLREWAPGNLKVLSALLYMVFWPLISDDWRIFL